MAERKSVNKYYPPDWDPSKGSVNKYVGQHPLRDRARKLSQGILVIRFELPYNIWCGGCNSHVGMGVRYNAEKTKVGNYYTTPIYKFRMKCHLCDNYFEIQTDPKNHDYVILCGARRKEQRWDPKENEQIVPEDKATQKKLATDAMYKLEHGSDDKQKGKSLVPTVGQIAGDREQYKEDYIINKIAREKFRNEKKAIKATEAADRALLLKSSLNISLVKETEDDKRLAGLLRLQPTETFDEKQVLKRKEIESRSIFVTPNSKETTSSLSILAKNIAMNNKTPFDIKKSPSDSVKQMKDLGIKKRSAVQDNGEKSDVILPKVAKTNSYSSNVGSSSEDVNCCSRSDSFLIGENVSTDTEKLIRKSKDDIKNKDSGQCTKTVSSNSETDFQTNGKKISTNALGLVLAYSDSESDSSNS